jgi:hypothetical protein
MLATALQGEENVCVLDDGADPAPLLLPGLIQRGDDRAFWACGSVQAPHGESADRTHRPQRFPVGVVEQPLGGVRALVAHPLGYCPLRLGRSDKKARTYFLAGGRGLMR